MTSDVAEILSSLPTLTGATGQVRYATELRIFLAEQVIRMGDDDRAAKLLSCTDAKALVAMVQPSKFDITRCRRWDDVFWNGAAASFFKWSK